MRFLLVFIFTLSIHFVFAQSKIQNKINQIAQSEMMKNGSLGVAVIDVNSGKIIASNDLDKILIPASTLKTVTTASALKILGEAYKFKTELQYDGRIENGVLKGNLYIKGFGDPTLGSDQMQGVILLDNLLQIWIKAIQEAGIQQIDGLVVGDASYFKGNIAGKTWQWYDLGNYYASGTWGLNLHENLYYLSFQQKIQLGSTPKIVKVIPEVPNLYFVNQLQSAGKNTGDNAYIYGGPYAYTRFIRGTIPIGNDLFTIKGSIPDPPFFAAHSLLHALEKTGISTQKRATTSLEISSKNDRKILHTHYSPNLQKIAQRTNFKSVNLYAEALIRAIGAKSNTENSLEGGIASVKNYWESQGIDMSGFFLYDGSGLSPRNGITPKQLASILSSVAKDKTIFNAFYESMPVGGRSGTVKYMFKNTKAEGNIRVKSGSLEHVRSYTGYAKTSAGQLLAFAVIANNYNGSSRTIRKSLEQLMISFCE